VNRISSERRSRSGQALIEFALVLPLLIWLIVYVVNFGGLFFAWITVTNATRAGAQYMMMGTSTVGGTQPTANTVASLVQEDLKPLTGATIIACLTFNGTASCYSTPTSGLGSATNDPEGTTAYATVSVDVTYTYTPIIRSWTFSRLGISLLLGPTTKAVHHKAVMRMG
jgi:Flp pilus assembly protein TadG